MVELTEEIRRLVGQVRHRLLLYIEDTAETDA